MCYNGGKEESVELRRRLDPKKIFVGLYVILFVIYIIVGLRPAGAAEYTISAELSIPSIGLESNVTALELENYKLNTPDTIAGSYSQADNKTLLIGHSTTVFQDLDLVKLGDLINYNDKNYRVVRLDMRRKSQIDMNEILAGAERDTLMIMTCAGQLLDGGDATHRLVVTAVIEE